MRIIDKIRTLFKRKAQVPQSEVYQPNELVKSFREGKCPDCHGVDFYEGPSGGMCINYKCANAACGSRFNIGFAFGNKVIFAERI